MDGQEKQKVLADWTAQWKTERGKLERVVQPGTDPGTRRRSHAIPEDTPPNQAVLELHSGLQKAESSVLVQARTGRIGLAKFFLYNHKAPGILSAQCRCRAGEKTPRHMALYCTEEAGRRPGIRTNGKASYQQLIGTASGSKQFSKWLICSGRIGQLSVPRSRLYNQ